MHKCVDSGAGIYYGQLGFGDHMPGNYASLLVVGGGGYLLILSRNLSEKPPGKSLEHCTGTRLTLKYWQGCILLLSFPQVARFSPFHQ